MKNASMKAFGDELESDERGGKRSFINRFQFDDTNIIRKEMRQKVRG
jgi:hypothetical protein